MLKKIKEIVVLPFIVLFPRLFPERWVTLPNNLRGYDVLAAVHQTYVEYIYNSLKDSKMLDLTKPIRTRDGKHIVTEFKLFETAKLDYRIVAVVDDDLRAYTINGRYLSSDTMQDDSDLVNYEPEKIRYWSKPKHVPDTAIYIRSKANNDKRRYLFTIQDDGLGVIGMSNNQNHIVTWSNLSTKEYYCIDKKTWLEPTIQE